jgi:hypothetical protein
MAAPVLVVVRHSERSEESLVKSEILRFAQDDKKILRFAQDDKKDDRG